jgi:hypothetical protein
MFGCHSELKGSFYNKVIFHPIYKILSRTVLGRRSLLHTQKLKGTALADTYYASDRGDRHLTGTVAAIQSASVACRHAC